MSDVRYHEPRKLGSAQLDAKRLDELRKELVTASPENCETALLKVEEAFKNYVDLRDKPPKKRFTAAKRRKHAADMVGALETLSRILHKDKMAKRFIFARMGPRFDGTQRERIQKGEQAVGRFLRRLTKAAENYQENLPSGQGKKKKDPELHRLVARLVRIWIKYSGKRFSVMDPRQQAKRASANGFVRLVLEPLVPELKEATVSYLLNCARKNLKS